MQRYQMYLRWISHWLGLELSVFLRFCCYQPMNILNMTLFPKHTNYKILTLHSGLFPVSFVWVLHTFFSMWISKIRLVILADFLKISLDSCNCLVTCYCLQFPNLKMEYCLLEFAGYLFMTLYLWNCLEAMECGNGFHRSSVGLLVFANTFYKK